MAKPGTTYALPRTFWTTKDHERVLDMHDAGYTDAEIAAALGGHTVHAVRQRRSRLIARTGGTSAYRSRDVARIVGVDHKTAIRWLTMGWLVGSRSGLRKGTTANEWRVDDEALRAFIADRTHWPRWQPERVADAWQPFVREVRAVRLLSVADVADRLGYHVRVIQARIKRGDIRALGFDPRFKRARALWVAEDELKEIA